MLFPDGASAGTNKTIQKFTNRTKKKEIVMFFTKLFGNMFMDIDRRCTGNKLDLKTTARFYRALANM